MHCLPVVDERAPLTIAHLRLRAGMFEGQVRRILDVPPKDIHDRCPIVMGCERDVSKVLNRYSSADDDAAVQNGGATKKARSN